MNRPDGHDLDRLLDWLCALPEPMQQPILEEARRWVGALTPIPARVLPPNASESQSLVSVLRQLIEQATVQAQRVEGAPQISVLPMLEPCRRCGAPGLGTNNTVLEGVHRYEVYTFSCPHCGLTLPTPLPHPQVSAPNR